MAKKTTSQRVSALAAKLIRRLDKAEAHWPISFTETDRSIRDICRVGDLRSLLMSLVSQDETKGNAKPKKRAAGKRRKA